jgi:hypothetical protein
MGPFLCVRKAGLNILRDQSLSHSGRDSPVAAEEASVTRNHRTGEPKEETDVPVSC